MKTIMQLRIHDLILPAVDRFAGNTDMDKFARVRYNSPDDIVVDFVVPFLTIALDDNELILEFPNHNNGSFRLENNEYSSIEII